MTPRSIKRFLAAEDGLAAIELALVAPVIAGLAMVSFAVWNSGTRMQDMRSAAEAGAEYYMNGGSNDDVARDITLDAWHSRPEVAEVDTQRSCRCGTTIVLCTAQCAGGAPPAVYVTLSAHGVEADALVSPEATLDRVVRVR